MTSQPLVISGPPRSGTTLVYTLFDGHPDIFWMISEGHFFEYLSDLGEGAAGSFCEAADRDLEALVQGLRDREVLPDVTDGYRQEAGTTSKMHVPIPWDEEAFRRKLADLRLGSVPAFWRGLVEAYAAALGRPPRRYACMKSPDYGKSAEGAIRNHPEARVLVVTREPLYVANSLKRSRDMRGAKLLNWPGLALFAASMNQMAARVSALPPERVRVVRYEALVSEPEATMRAIAQWLGIEMHPSLLAPTVLGQPWPGHSSFAPTSGIETTPATRGLAALDEHDLRFLRKHVAPYARTFGYAL